MLYLAKLQTVDVNSKVSLALLGCQNSENNWSLAPDSATALVENALSEFLRSHNEPFEEFLAPGKILLAEVAETGQVKSAQDATAWFLLLIEQYLSRDLTPEILVMEAERAEEWRQFLTLQNQDVVRRSLEVETRREQIQELERGLEDKRIKLESMQEKLISDQADLQELKRDLEDQRIKLDNMQDKLISDQADLVEKQKN